MNKLKISGPAVEDIKFEGKEYFRIEKAAALLKCESDDILHFGVLGKVQITGPVICSGKYEWPLCDEMILIPELENPFNRPFDPTDRVIFSKTSLAHIEAIGWVSLNSFSAPYAVREAIESIKEFIDDQKKPICTKFYSSIETDYKNTISFLDSLLDHELHSPWRLIEKAEDNESKITINHLSISKDELARLAIGNSQDPTAIKQIASINQSPEKSTHGNSIRNAEKRDSIYKAALYCSIHFPDLCNKMNYNRWAQTIEDKGYLFWSKTGLPPYQKERIARLLSDVVENKVSS